MSLGSFVNSAIKGYDFVDHEIDETKLENQRTSAIDLQNKRFDEQQAYNRQQDTINNEYRAQAVDMQRQSHDAQMRNTSFQQNQAEMEALRLRAIEQGKLASIGAIEYPWELHAELEERGMSGMSYYNYAEHPEQLNALKVAEPYLEQMLQGDLSVAEFGSVDGGQFTPGRNEELRQALNTIHAGSLSQGVGEVDPESGKTIVKKEIGRINASPAPGKIGMDLLVYYSDGTEALKPVTKNRSSDPNDPVKLLPFEMAMDDFMGRVATAKFYEQNREQVDGQFQSALNVVAETYGLNGQDDMPSSWREFQEMTKGMSPEDYDQARRVELGLEARAGTTSASERIATDEGLGQQVAEQGALEAGAAEEARLTVQANMRPEIEAAMTLARKNAEGQSEAEISAAQVQAALPGLRDVTDRLLSLAEIATYTKTGVALNAISRELGFQPGEGATARAAYEATVDNEVLPLMRQIFGAAFTQTEGESLKAILGDLNKSPEEKRVALDAFIEAQVRKATTEMKTAELIGGSGEQAAEQGAAPELDIFSQADAILEGL